MSCTGVPPHCASCSPSALPVLSQCSPQWQLTSSGTPVLPAGARSAPLVSIAVGELQEDLPRGQRVLEAREAGDWAPRVEQVLHAQRQGRLVTGNEEEVGSRQ